MGKVCVVDIVTLALACFVTWNGRSTAWDLLEVNEPFFTPSV